MLIIERFCIPFYGSFKTESLSDRVRVRPAALRRWLSTKTVLHFVGRFGGFVWRFRGSGRAIVLSRSRWISSLLIFWPRTKTEIWTKKNFIDLLLLTCGVEDAAAGLSAPISLCLDQLEWRGLCSTCSTARLSQIDCFLLQFSLFLCCSIRRLKVSRGLLERPAKRSDRTVTNSRATSSGAGCPRRKTPTHFAFACRKRSRISLFLSLSRLNRSCFPLVAMLQNRLGTRTKTSQTRVFSVVAVHLLLVPLYQAVTFPKMIDGISLRFRFDRPFERPFRNQFSELAPRPQHSVQKIPSNGMQNLPNKLGLVRFRTTQANGNNFLFSSTGSQEKIYGLCKRHVRVLQQLPYGLHFSSCYLEEREKKK